MRVRRPDVLAAVIAAVCLTSASTEPPAGGDAGARLHDPIAVIELWNDTRNHGDVAGALALPADDASVLGYRLAEPGDRAELTEIMAAQATAGFHLTGHACLATGCVVTCHYDMDDEVIEDALAEARGTTADRIRVQVLANLRRIVRGDPHLGPWRPLLAATGAGRPDESSST